MDAIYTVVTETGRFFQVRCDSRDAVCMIKQRAESVIQGFAKVEESVLDVVDEAAAKDDDYEEDQEDDEWVTETKYMTKEQDFVEIPRDLEIMKRLGIQVDVLALRFQSLVNQVEQLDEVKVAEAVPVEVPLMEEEPEVEEQVEEEVGEPEEYVELDIRPREQIKVIAGVAETKDHSSLFDE